MKDDRPMETETRPRPYMTVAQVARQYEISQQTVYRRIWDGTLTAYRPGRIIRLDPAEVAEVFRESPQDAA